MNWWQVCLFQVGIWSSSFIFYYLHFPINRLIHGAKQNNDEIPEKNDDLQQSGNVIYTNGNAPSKNTEVTYKHEERKEKNGEAIDNNGDAKANGSQVNGEQNNVFAINPSNADTKIPPFSTRSWSLKYRNLRSQFENSSL